ncbi:MAG: hypothetical protein AB7P23_07880, partial [Amphiplicatus sp.]
LVCIILTSLSYLKYSTFAAEDFYTFYYMSAPSLLDRVSHATADLFWRPLRENLLGLLIADFSFSAFEAQFTMMTFFFVGLVLYFQSFRLLLRLDGHSLSPRASGAAFLVLCALVGLSRSFRECVWFLQTGAENGGVFVFNGAVLLLSILRCYRPARRRLFNAAIFACLAAAIFMKETGAASLAIPFIISAFFELSERLKKEGRFHLVHLWRAGTRAVAENYFFAALLPGYVALRLYALHIPFTSAPLGGYFARAANIVVNRSADIFVASYSGEIAGLAKAALAATALLLPAGYLFARGLRLTVSFCAAMSALLFIPIPAAWTWGPAGWLPPAALFFVMSAFALVFAARDALRLDNKRARAAAALSAALMSLPLVIAAQHWGDAAAHLRPRHVQYDRAVAALSRLRGEISEAAREGLPIRMESFRRFQDGKEFLYLVFAKEFGEILPFRDIDPAPAPTQALNLVYRETEAGDVDITASRVDLPPPRPAPTLAEIEAASDGAGAGLVENFGVRAGDLAVMGWAVDFEAGKPARSLVVFVNGAFAGRIEPRFERADVAQGYRNQGFLMAGFDDRVPLDPSYDGRRIGFRAFAEMADGRYFELPCANGQCVRKVTDIQRV